MSTIKWVGSIIGVLVVVGAMSKNEPSRPAIVGASTVGASTSTAHTTAAPEPPSPQCPSGYTVAGSRGCFTVDTVSKDYGDTYSVRGKVISKESCSNLIVTLSATDSAGNVICDGNGIVTDVAGGKPEAWSGNILNCERKPANVSLKLSACM